MSKKEKREKTHGHGQQYGDYEECWEVKMGIGGINGDGRRPEWGGKHTIQCADVWWNCAPKTCIILLTSVTPKFIKKEKSKVYLFDNKFKVQAIFYDSLIVLEGSVIV